jgi:hypothetical protein
MLRRRGTPAINGIVHPEFTALHYIAQPFSGTDHMKPTQLLLCAAALLVPSCATVTESGSSYIAASTAGKSSLSGAKVSGEFIPVPASAAAANRNLNSFKFTLYATGGYGTHRQMTVHGLSYRWSSGVRDVLPAAYTGKSVAFRNSLTSGVTQATWHVPGELQADFARESGVTVEADVSISSRKGTERRVVALKFDRSAITRPSVQTAPMQLVREAKMRNVPFSDLDVGANRLDWQP